MASKTVIRPILISGATESKTFAPLILISGATESKILIVERKGAFHSTKFSGLKFGVFHATNGTIFSCSKFGAKTEDSFTFVYLLSGCSIDDAEVKINDVLGEGDNTTYNLS